MPPDRISETEPGKVAVGAYPFDPKLDEAFVHELIEDFHDLDILEETKATTELRGSRRQARFGRAYVVLGVLDP
jgi:hypothetical protein